MKKIILLCIPALLMAYACNNSKSTENKSGNTGTAGDSSKTEIYQCPMDCEKGKTYDQPGQCPVCGMDLEKKK